MEILVLQQGSDDGSALFAATAFSTFKIVGGGGNTIGFDCPDTA